MPRKKRDEIGKTIGETITDAVRRQAPKHVRNGGGRNSPMIGDNGLQLEPGDNMKFMDINISLFKMRNIDMTDVDQVEQRLSDYFELYARHDVKPTVVGMALALNGHDRQWLWAVTHNAPAGGTGNREKLPTLVSDCIKRAYNMLENSWETYMQNGKINPVAGIFLGKNNFAYKDQTEHIVTPNAGEQINTEEIKQRYITGDSIE